MVLRRAAAASVREPVDALSTRRPELNRRMAEEDSFFEFASLDDAVYAEGAIPKSYKELLGPAISVAMRCEECVVYHLQECERRRLERPAVVEAIKVGAIAGESVTYPTARAAFSALEQLDVRGLRFYPTGCDIISTNLRTVLQLRMVIDP